MVEPLLVVGTAMELFSVFTHVIVCAAALKSRTLTVNICPSTALAVVMVIVSVAALLFVTVLMAEVTGTVAALPEAVMALFVVITWLNVCVPVNVCAASVLAMVAVVDGKVMVVPSVPLSVKLLVKFNVFAAVPVSV